MRIHFTEWIRRQPGFPYGELSPRHGPTLNMKFKEIQNFRAKISAHAQRQLPVGFPTLFHNFRGSCRGRTHFNLTRLLAMEQLAEINFLAAIEGQELERAMARLVSILATLFPFCPDAKRHLQTWNS